MWSEFRLNCCPATVDFPFVRFNELCTEVLCLLQIETIGVDQEVSGSRGVTANLLVIDEVC